MSQTIAVNIDTPFLTSPVMVPVGKELVISIVAYETPDGLPARFLAGVMPAIDVAQKATESGISTVVRVIDPAPIASHFNGWDAYPTSHHELLSSFFGQCGVKFYIDRAATVTPDMECVIDSLASVLNELLNQDGVSESASIAAYKQLLKSAEKRGQEGLKNTLRYVAAHPFSWLEFYHESLWSNRHNLDAHYINLMSKSESRFTAVGDLLLGYGTDFCSGLKPKRYHFTCCKMPSYVRQPDEPSFVDLKTIGPRACLERYGELAKRDSSRFRGPKGDLDLFLTFLTTQSLARL